MIVLDENIPESQRQLLLSARLSLKRIGVEAGRKGMKDREILALLHEFHRPTFFTLDADFYKRDLAHTRYCLMHLAVDEDYVAEFIRRLLRFDPFSTHAKRMGAVIRVMPTGVSFWRSLATTEVRLRWEEEKGIR